MYRNSRYPQPHDPFFRGPYGMPPYDPWEDHNNRLYQGFLTIIIIVLIFFVGGMWLQNNYGLQSNPYNVTQDSLGASTQAKTEQTDYPKDETTVITPPLTPPEEDVGSSYEEDTYPAPPEETDSPEEYVAPQTPVIVHEYYAQASAHADAIKAFTAKDDWIKKNRQSTVQPIPNHPQKWFRVLVGPFNTPQEALAFIDGPNNIFELVNGQFIELTP